MSVYPASSTPTCTTLPADSKARINTLFKGSYMLTHLLCKVSGPLVFQATAYRFGRSLEISLRHEGEWVATFADTPGAALSELVQTMRDLRHAGIKARVNLRIHPASMCFQGEGLSLSDLPGLPF